MQQAENELDDKGQRHGMVGINEETAFRKERVHLLGSSINALGRQSDGQHHAQQDSHTGYILRPLFFPEDS